jgi:protein SCO1
MRPHPTAHTTVPRRVRTVAGFVRAALLAGGLAALLGACGRAPADGAQSVATVALQGDATHGAAVPAQDAHEHAGHDHASEAHAGHDHAAPLAADAPLPGASLLHLDDVWTDHRGNAVRLADGRGHPTVVVLFYGTCISACPVLLRDAELIEAALPDDVRDATRFLMVTFDPERDTPERLAAYAAEKGLDRERWSFLTADERAVRRLAAALGVRYRPDGQGGFAHTNLITVLDAGGVPVARLEGLGLGPDAAVAALTAVR